MVEMDFLKDIFGENSLTFTDFERAINANGKIKLADVGAGGYVAKSEYDNATKTIGDLQQAVKKFDGVDVEGLKSQISTLQLDFDNARLNWAVENALKGANAINPKAVMKLFDY
ncbi:hypothetical protein FACS189490_04070 [Clostridia bacterium]|nr:hypothetical protein FACS189490_04070 [Clostridia bacterium]